MNPKGLIKEIKVTNLPFFNRSFSIKKRARLLQCLVFFLQTTESMRSGHFSQKCFKTTGVPETKISRKYDNILSPKTICQTVPKIHVSFIVDVLS